MLLKQILRIFWREKALILGVTVLVTVVTLFLSLFQPPKFEVYLDIEVKRINRMTTPDYQYDEYYAIQSADLVSNTILSWFESKNFANTILTEAGFDQNDLPRFGRFIMVKKLSPQNLEVKITTDTGKTGTKLAKIIEEEVSSRILDLNLNDEGNPTFKTDVNIGLPEQIWINIPYALLAGLFGGLLLGAFLALVFHYFRT